MSSRIVIASLDDVGGVLTALMVISTVSVEEEKADVPPFVEVSTLLPAEPDV